MNKSNLVEQLKAKTGLPAKDVEAVVTRTFDIMTAALAKGEKVSIHGFGSFFAKQRRARKGRDPRTGAAVQIPAKRAVKFKPGSNLKERVNV